MVRPETFVEIDPETVRKGVRNLMQQVAQVERERVSKLTLVSKVEHNQIIFQEFIHSSIYLFFSS